MEYKSWLQDVFYFIVQLYFHLLWILPVLFPNLFFVIWIYHSLVLCCVPHLQIHLLECSFFSWFGNTQPKGMIDDMQDEVSWICSWQSSRALFIGGSIVEFYLLYQIVYWSWYNPLQKKMQVAEIIKEDLWPNPLSYFNTVIELFFVLFSFPFFLENETWNQV